MTNSGRLKIGLAIALVSCLGFAGGFATKALMDSTSVETSSVTVTENGGLKKHRSFASNRLTANDPLNNHHIWDAFHDPFQMMNDFELDGPGFSPFMPQMPQMAFSSGLRNLNVSENEKTVQVTAEAPGLTAQDLKVQARDRSLTIQSHKVKKEGPEGHAQTLDESFQQTISLPCSVKGEQAVTSVKEGMLTISIPKTVPGVPRRDQYNQDRNHDIHSNGDEDNRQVQI